MARRRRLGKKFFKSLLPIVLLLVVALVVALAFIVYGVTRPPRRPYLVTPEAFAEFSGPALKVSDQTWHNRDNTTARGWLLKGRAGGPAVVLSHRYGVDRSWFFNLGIKINEATGATILWPDLRGHGLDPPVSWTSFGSLEGEDIQGALDYLRTLKSPDGQALVGDKVALYGVEMGAYASLKPAAGDAAIRVLVLDSLPRDPEEVLQAAVRNDLEIDNGPLRFLTSAAMQAYFLGRFKNIATCELVGALKEQKVLLLSGLDARHLRDSTIDIIKCFPNKANLEVKIDLPLTGFKLPSATGEQGEGYDRLVIDFLDRNLR